MRRLFKRLGIFREGVAIETQRSTSTSERGFWESAGLFVSLGSQNMEEPVAQPLTSFSLTPSLLLPLAFRISLSLQRAPLEPVPSSTGRIWLQCILTLGMVHWAFPGCIWLSTSTAFLLWRDRRGSVRLGEERAEDEETVTLKNLPATVYWECLAWALYWSCGRQWEEWGWFPLSKSLKLSSRSRWRGWRGGYKKSWENNERHKLWV